jgi:hypothetical protein
LVPDDIDVGPEADMQEAHLWNGLIGWT